MTRKRSTWCTSKTQKHAGTRSVHTARQAEHLTSSLDCHRVVRRNCKWVSGLLSRSSPLGSNSCRNEGTTSHAGHRIRPWCSHQAAQTTAPRRSSNQDSCNLIQRLLGRWGSFYVQSMDYDSSWTIRKGSGPMQRVWATLESSFIRWWKPLPLQYSATNKHVLTTAAEGKGFEGNRTRNLWKETCIRLAREVSHRRWVFKLQSSIGIYERAIYAALGGDLEGMLSVANSWHDCVWAYFRYNLLNRIDQVI